MRSKPATRVRTTAAVFLLTSATEATMISWPDSLREAAMNEEDPELREKLWDEYRAYKKGTKS